MFIIANFKQNLNSRNILEYFNSFNSYFVNFSLHPDIQIIFCPAFIHLEKVNDLVRDFSFISVGAQNVSKFPAGSYTGEVGSDQLKDYCKYCIIGHSERRSNFSESAQEINDKAARLNENNIMPIICIRSKEDFLSIETNDKIIAYEPVNRIGGTEAESPDQITGFYNTLDTNYPIIYGGSVNASNVLSIVNLPFINGLLVGGASLQPETFFALISEVNKKYL